MIRRGSETTLIDFFPHTPRKRRQFSKDGFFEITADFGTATQTFHIGPATSATPGFISGLMTMHRNGAVLAFADLVAPAIQAARSGVTVTQYQHSLARVVQPILTATPEAAALFAPHGELYPPGEVFRNPGLADTFETVLRDGFAGSAVARGIIADQSSNGHLTGDDLASYRVVSRKPLCAKLHGARVHLNPLPAASGVLIAHSLAALAGDGPIAMAEALRSTDRARRKSEGHLSRLADLSIRQRGTTHVSIVDADRNACGVTVSNGEGNGWLVGDFGFMLNNVLGEEDINSGLAAGWSENTRLSSMMSPAIIEDGDGGFVVLGSGGSNRIRSAIFQVAVRHCVQKLDLPAAIRAPRLHVEGGRLDFEAQFDRKDQEAFVQTFPVYRAWPQPNMFFGGVHAVRVDCGGLFSGAGDARRDGVCMVVD